MAAKIETLTLDPEQGSALEKIRAFKQAEAARLPEELHGLQIPRLFGRSPAGNLFKRDDKGELSVFVCRDFPVISRELRHLETGEVLYTLEWRKRNRKHTQTVPARQISSKNELVKLSDYGLAVNDNNVKDLITYFAQFQVENDIPEAAAAGRLGYIESAGHREFIHPLRAEENGITITTADIGERQTLEAFQAAGTSAEWLEDVFGKVKGHPKALAVTLASFASVLLTDLNLSPFIVDLSGVTSRGKTTALRVAASVWGTERLMNEWNATRVSVERKAAFLNSFPALYDDTMKANPKQLQDVIYNFSGGKSKGRGSIKGSQAEFTWKNLLISTGENSLIEYAQEAGGAAARVLPLVGLPFGEEGTHDYFNGLYEALERYHGQIGLDFIDRWEEEKAGLIGLYHGYKQKFQEAANGNEVMARISLHYAAIVFTGHLLNEFFHADVNLDSLVRLFEEVKRENKAIDKPMQRLESILSDLDRNRAAIWYHDEYRPAREFGAFFNDGTLYLMVAYVKDSLGPEMNMIRQEWRRRGITYTFERNGNQIDTKRKRHGAKNEYLNGIPIHPRILEELGFDFSKNES